MNKQFTRSTAALGLAAILLMHLNAAALFGGRKQAEAPEEGAPIVQDLSITTYRGIPYQAQFLASDAEGDDLTISIADEPKRGSVAVDGMNFTYTPKDNAIGTDRFTYLATDSAGHQSLPATVSITIEKVRSGVTYQDMAGNSAAAAAQSLAENGIFVGSRVGEQYFFEPERAVSRSEFLAMAMETSQQNAPSVTLTGFCDDQAIPTWAKAYASAGVASGILKGFATEQGAAFRGEQPITFQEAAAVLNRLLNLTDVDLTVWYADRTQVPSWAAQAVGNLEAVSVLPTGSFGSERMSQSVTRADAAQMLSAVSTLLHKR